ncbi:enoyl-CoA hydratase [Lutibacter sp. HS1-25]|uniref:enoyl-CoA hydratase/isomerase family protein n=1 Tax=Lutibacter sp. HS1-25 TaxID=2485000 RepID=UPI0010129C1C|nr:enoyl-CoA hydratase-related protein [Lutibacter sp. HS1-25]RXP45856.1 enoyl-CoA hydratase [Lutibacter sp. HS1-25]
MNLENVLVDLKENIGIVTVNRPNKLNALNKKTIDELHLAFKKLNEDSNVKVIIVTGSGEKAFVAGADIAEFSNFDIEEGTELSRKGHEILFSYVQNLETPVIAAVNGFALGGGLELAMAAHFRVASSNAKMGLPEVSLGVIPGYGGTQRLPQLVGKGKAMEMIMSASMISAEEAKEWGLVNYVVEQAELLPLCEKLAKKISQNSSVAISAAIKAVNANYTNCVNGYSVEIENFGLSFGTDDFKEGTTAFLEKRKPNFD